MRIFPRTTLLSLLSALLAVPALAAELEPLPVLDPHAEVRALLEAGRAEAARERLGVPAEGAIAHTTVPGLVGEALEKGGDFARAMELYQAEVSAGTTTAQGPVPPRAAARLRLARALARVERAEEASQVYLEVLDDGLFADDPLVLDEIARFFQASGKATEAVRAFVALSVPPTRREPRGGDVPGREALSRVLRFLVEHGEEAGHGDVKELAIERLYRDLPDTKAARGVERMAKGAFKKRLLTARTALARARALEAGHENEAVLETLAPLRPKAKDASEAACEVRYLLGKTERKMRRYKSARRDLDFVADQCPEPFRKKARYLAAQVSSFGDAKAALEVLDAFLAAYPKDAYADDVWVWKAEILAQQGKLDDSARAYRHIVDTLPNGDMYHKARFGLALLLAKSGDTGGARALLDEIARTAQKAPVMVRDQALYWRARLLVFPHLESLTPTAEEGQRAEGLRALASFAAARPASYYGHLARLLAREAAQRTKTDLAPIEALLKEGALAKRDALDESRGLPIPASLEKDAGFLAALALLRAGYDPEAERVLDRLSWRDLDGNERLVVTLAYRRARARDKAHRVMRASGNALPEGKPTPETLLSWSLSFPRAYADAITAASAKENLSPELLFGLAREESAFEAEVVSWAGAIGLCQLMPPTAREEAARLKIKLTSLEELREPGLNARLGAAHLSRRMSLGHPLLAIAAYNAGPGNVNKWRKALLLKPLDVFVESIPVEQTRNYVKKVTGSWVVYEALDGDVDKVQFSVELP